MSRTLLPARPTGAFSPLAFRPRPPIDPAPAAAARRQAAQALHPAAARPAPVASAPVDEPLATDVLEVIAAGLAEAVPHDHLPEPEVGERAYRRLLGTDRYDAWLIAWSPSGALDLHDHGGSRGVVRVVRGRLSETFTDRDRPRPLRTRTFAEGAGFVVPPDRIHEVWNPGATTAWSVHVYSPPLSSMTYFQRTGQGALSETHAEPVDPTDDTLEVGPRAGVEQ